MPGNGNAKQRNNHDVNFARESNPTYTTLLRNTLKTNKFLENLTGRTHTEVLNASFTAGALPPSQRTALISLIFKKGDRTEHKN